jgi:nitric oxide dioxygenase
MSPDQVVLVKSSFARVAPISEQAAAIFYARLFEIAPEVRPLFKGDVTEQGRKLMKTLTVVVNGLSDLPSILPAAEALAIRHVSFGVRPEHYAPVGEALIYTLGKGLGDAFTEETKAAWIGAYTLLSGFMIEKAATAQAAE